MIIREINTDKQIATVTFNYDELRCLCNSMAQLGSCKFEKDKDFNNVYAKTIELFCLVKHCMIPEFEMKEICKLLFDSDDKNEKGSEKQ